MKMITRYCKKYLATGLLVALFGIGAKAQNEPIIAHYIYHTDMFNPAVPGNTRDIYVGAMIRQQWVGFSGAPATQLLDAYGFIPKIRGGVSFTFQNDMLGHERQTMFRLGYAYSQRLTDQSTLSFGLGVGMLNVGVKGSELIYQDQLNADQSAILSDVNKFKPYLSAGLEFNGYHFTAGFAVTNLDQSIGKSTVFKVPRHYFGYAKYSWDINSKINLTPSVFVRSINYTAQAEVNVSATFKKRIMAGVFYRTTDAVGAMLGVYITKHFLLSYSYDFDCGVLSHYQSGSHEVNLVYRFDGIKEKRIFYKSPRYLN